MLTLDNVHDTDFDKLKIDEQWNYEYEIEHRMHHIHENVL